MAVETGEITLQIDPALVAEAAAAGMGIIVEADPTRIVVRLPESVGISRPVVPPHLVAPLNALIGAADLIVARHVGVASGSIEDAIDEMQRAIRIFRGMVTFAPHGQGD